MKHLNKNKKSHNGRIAKWQPDPILKETKKKTEKLGSSQKKRLQKRIKVQFEKRQKYFSKDKGKLKNENSKNLVVKDLSDDSQESTKEEDIVEEIREEELTDEEMSEDENNEMPIEIKKIDGFNLDNENSCDDFENDFEKMDDSVNSDDDDSVDDMESIIEDDKEDDEKDDMVTNINIGNDVIKVTDLDSLNCRIKANMDILNDFKDFKSKIQGDCKPRKFYVSQYLEDLCMKFSYNKFLINKFYDLFNNELFKFLVASEEDRPLTIRTNTLKTSRRQLKENLINRECNVENLQFSKVGMVVFSTKCAIGATPEYLAGHYLLQGSSSMLPVLALAPKRGERILDMCAAPGGKTTYIAQIMCNTGVVFANDINKDRLKAVSSNLSRMGIMNTIVTVHDGRNIHKKIKNFDRVLCDAPCTGTGVISKDKSIKASKDESDLKILTFTQKQLICSAIDACKVGGFIVYSTCSVLVEENEQVVDYACRKRNVKLVQTGLFGTKGFTNYCSLHFNKDMDRARRYYPHENNMDGFFLAKLQKIGETPKEKK